MNLSFDEIKTPIIDSRTCEANHPDCGSRVMQVTIWEKYGSTIVRPRWRTTGKKMRRFLRKCEMYEMHLWDGNFTNIIVFDERPGYARKKAYVTDQDIFDILNVGKTYDLVCFSRSWMCGVPTIVGIDIQRQPYIVALLCSLGIISPVARIILEYIA